MADNVADKTCLILLGMGGPDKLEDVREFLYNIFSDRSIIQLPGGKLLQKPFATIITRLRLNSVMENYQKIGGASPLLKWTEAQKENIEFALSPLMPGFKTYIGMRYFKPYIKDTIAQAYSDGFRKFCFLPMYPQYCRATTGSSFEEVKRKLKEYDDIKAVFINDFHDNKQYIQLLSEYINNNIKIDDTLLFSAHSIPQKFVDNGDPYVEQVKKTVEQASAGRKYHLSFQSRTGPVKWVGPDTVARTKRLLNENKKIFIVPISFVCDHIETLSEIDIELKKILGVENKNVIRRMPMFNDDKKFGAMLAELVLEKINSGN
jgi:ferrochelatase